MGELEIDVLDAQLKALEDAERAIDSAYGTGKAERAKITQAAQLDAAEAVAMAGIAMESDEAADEAMRIRVIAEKSGDREKTRDARKRERDARKKANSDHRAATQAARKAYDAVRFSAPNRMGFMRAVQIAFAAHIAFVLVWLVLTSRDHMTYDVSSMMDWLMVILEGVAFWMFINRYKIGRPFVMGMAAIGILVPVAFDVATGQFNPFTLSINGVFYVFLIVYFATSRRVKATLVNEFGERTGDYDKESFEVSRSGWPFVRNLVIYFILFSVIGHWMEMGMCQFIIMGLVQGEYDPTNTMLWRDWLYPFPMEGAAVVVIALVLYPFWLWLRKKFPGKKIIVAYLLSFISGALLCTVIEFGMGLIVNADLQLWDYTDNFPNFMGQICLQNTMAFGVVASVITWWVYPLLERLIARVRPEIMNIVFVVVLIFGGIIWSLYIIDPPEASSATESSAGADSEESAEPYGSPWITSNVQGNLPAEQPSATDDFYTHVNYDFLAAHQDDPADYMSSTAGEVQEAAVAAIKDESRTDHDIAQMRILYGQAADLDALKEIGFSEVQPYIDMIDAVSSIDEMNALLASDDFPFSPFLQAFVGVVDTRGENVVSVTANLVCADALMSGGKYYQDSDDELEASVNGMMLTSTMSGTLMDSTLIGVDQADLDTWNALMQFEKSYAKYVDYADKWLSADFGEEAKDYAASSFTLDELCALCPSFPLKEVLGKLGKGQSAAYIAASHEWLPALNDAWTDENLDMIKLAAKCKVLAETAPFRDPSTKDDLMSSMNEGLGEAAADLGVDVDDAQMEGLLSDPETFAYAACNTMNTFSQVIAKVYVEDALGQKAKDRLTALTRNLVAEYKDLIADAAWLGAESDELVTEKLDNMALNILEPDDGYFDYSGLQLVPTEEGGTLFSNYLLLKQYRYDREAELIGKPATRSAVWYEVDPTMANAFYDPATNSINILPGFVTSAVYADDMSDAQVLAGAGFVIGHEISHGFDYTGAQFNAYAEPSPIFSDDDVKVFLAKCGQLADRYSAIEYSPGRFVNGQNVVGEAAADLNGLQAVMALAKAKGIGYEEVYGHFAPLWAEVQDKMTMAMVSTDTHPANNLRVNVNAQMFDPFYEAYGVEEGDTMYLAPDERVAFWGEQA